MVIGMMAIVMAGGVYCPLFPRDPQQRLHALLQQTQSRLVLVHYLTKDKFQNDVISSDINAVLTDENQGINVDVDRLSDVIVTPDSVAYIIFTSGSTGTPKAVQVCHRSFTGMIGSFVYKNIINGNDTIMQVARCSFDPHVRDILGSFIMGAALIMLHPGAIVDFQYLADVMKEKHITFLDTVPTVLYNLFTYLQQFDYITAMKCLRSLCTGGESCSAQLANLIQSIVNNTCQTWNMYGPAETTVGCTCHLLPIRTATENIPIGRPLSNYQHEVFDELLQRVSTNQEGELFVGGVGVFAGYLGRDDLTARIVVVIDGELFYRTGDLVRIGRDGFIHYVGRKDHQIKLHGQRIELGEIEQCLLQSSVSACVVVKWNDDHLVAYVQSSTIDEKQLREHCQSHLPPHMIPSKFIVLEKLPLNSNGKIDRKSLPSLDFSNVSPTTLESDAQLLMPRNEIEITVRQIWCDILQQNQISIDTNIFSIGGHSLLMMQMFHRYKVKFCLEQNPNFVSISTLFQNPTIIDHAKLIQQSINARHSLDDYSWSPLYLSQAKASFAQERIFLDEQIRFSSKTKMSNIYAIQMLYRITSVESRVSISRFRRALLAVVRAHPTLCTALYLDADGRLIQHYINTNNNIDDQQPFSFTITELDNNDRFDDKITEIMRQHDLFDLEKGWVMHCHILRQQHCRRLTSQNDDLLAYDDLIAIFIHHSAIDGYSMPLLSHDLSYAYQNDDSLPLDENTLQYMDYSVHERSTDMTTLRRFWYSQLEGYNFDQSLPLLFDRRRLSTERRSTVGVTNSVIFHDDIATGFLNYASAHQVTPYQLAFATFYAFLFKLTHGESDICIASLDANRYKPELRNIIGMFVATLPYRVQIDCEWSFNELVKHVQQKYTSICEHTHYPLQDILADFHRNQLNTSFLEIFFEFTTEERDVNQLNLLGTSLEQVPDLLSSTLYVLFDFELMFFYNSTLDSGKLSCLLNFSLDCFNEITLNTITKRFERFYSQLFTINFNNITTDEYVLPIRKLSIILPEEIAEMQGAMFHRLSTNANKGILISFCHF
ncbi:unnamed protein product [Adineta ricciae]|uniref:Carrier domain-containing protein n=1 Tax=Adineta ricciae TaxID=249248 RepID=A0A815NVV4_ADIRI|nr:unnamed protein product [Adineta ricciae]